jgi:c-di-GMP-related signal transduction protein
MYALMVPQEADTQPMPLTTTALLSDKPDEPSCMDIFLGRQPILDARQKTQAHELLFRSSLKNKFDGRDAEEATRHLISAAFFAFGVEEVGGSLPVFINFPRNLLLELKDIPLPNKMTVLEVLEDVDVDASLLEACRQLKRMGYRIALDDFTPAAAGSPLLPLLDYLKVDFRLTNPAERAQIATRHFRPGLTLLAEKVETRAEFEAAKRSGYTLFQGFFFARPEILQRSEVPALKTNCLRILREIHRSEPNLAAVAGLVRQDVALCRRVLRYVNSAAFAWLAPVTSVERALTSLGEVVSRRWLSMAVMPQLAVGSADALIATSLARAYFCQLAAGRTGHERSEEDLFLVGLFSLLDAMLGRPQEELLAEVGMPDRLQRVLLDPRCDTWESRIWRLTLACERTEPAEIEAAALAANLSIEFCAIAWTDSLGWSNEIAHQISAVEN